MSSTNEQETPHMVTFRQKIDNFVETPDSTSKDTRLISSKSFRIRTAILHPFYWHLMLNTTRYPRRDGRVPISIYLYLRIESGYRITVKKVFATLELSIIDNEGKKVLTKCTQVRPYIANQDQMKLGWGWKEFCFVDEDFETNLISDRALTIDGKLLFSEKRDVVHYNDRKLLKLNALKCNPIGDLASLLNTQAFSDVVISTKTKDFDVHKLILCVRSKVFTAMFQHDTKENQTNRIEIEDMNEEVVGEMLSFIYSGKPEKLIELDKELRSCGNFEEVQKLAEQVLAAADRYDLDDLKLITSKVLYNCLSTTNALEILKQADTHNAEELKNDVLQYIVDNASDVLAADDWKNTLSMSKLAEEVSQAMANRLTSETPEDTYINSS